ncbi:MAG: hypothetical protein R2854_19270 [Caldilineaceae bacterium]
MAWYLWWGAWALLRPDRRRRLATVFVCSLALTVLVLPVAPIALRQIPGYANPDLVVPSVAACHWTTGAPTPAATALPRACRACWARSGSARSWP